MKDKYNIDMSKQKSKLLEDIPSCDIYVSMGCNVTCPFVERDFDYNFGLDDPTGNDDNEFIKVIEAIKVKLTSL